MQSLLVGIYLFVKSTLPNARTLGLNEAAVRQRLSRARRLFQQLYLLESGEAIIDGSSLSSQGEARQQRLIGAARSRPALVAVSS